MTDITAPLDLTTRLRQHPEQVAAEADGEVRMMLRIDSDNDDGLNAVASVQRRASARAIGVRVSAS
jgi:hypothetical protein